MDEKEKETIYGKIITDFVNANTTDAACLNIFENVQRAFQFSPDFAKKAKQAFPSLQSFKSSLNKSERLLLKLIIQITNIYGFLTRQFSILGVDLFGFDSLKNTLTFRDVEYHAEITDGRPDADIQYSRPYNLEVSEIENEDWKQMKPQTFREVTKLMSVGQNMHRIMEKNSISESKFKELKDVMSYYVQLRNLHKDIRKTQTDLNILFRDILNRKKLHQSKQYEIMLSEYQPEVKINKDDLLTIDFSFTEGEYFQQYPRLPKNGIIHPDLIPKDIIEQGIINPMSVHTSHPYQTLIAISVVEFLKNPKNKKRIYRCRECGKFGISDTIKGRVYCSDKCKNKYNNRKNIQSGYMRRKKRERHALGLDQ